ncbi:MAG: hypothetical protein WAN86_21375 [Hyphomicrobiaceae bacterium]
MRTAFILGLLIAVAGAATYAIVFGPELGISVSSGPAQGTTKAAAEAKSPPSRVLAACKNIAAPEDAGQEPPVQGITGACEKLGADSFSCKQCIAMNRRDCEGRPKSSSAFPTYDWTTIRERELPRAVGEVSKAVAALKARTDAKLERDKAAVQKIYDTGTCIDTQSYLRDRIKELEQPDLQSTKDTVERSALCLREKHRELTKLMLDDLNPILYERIRVLGDAAIEMANLARDLGTSAAKTSQKLSELRKHNARCGN